jgi:gluconokinase
MVIVLMGVAGSGKTTVGKLLAQRLDWAFEDADDFHPPSNRAKMQRGVPLDENDRRPWLNAIRAAIIRYVNAGKNAIFACSALKQSYRELLAADAGDLKFIYLKGSPELIAARLAKRRGHFFNPALLRNQFDDLEEPHGAIVIDIAPPPETIAASIIAALALSSPRAES